MTTDAPTGPGQGAAPSGDWTAGLDAATRGFVEAKGWGSPADVIASYRDAETLIGRSPDQVLAIPGDQATDEEWHAVFGRLGRPATAEDYRLDGDHPLGDEARTRFREAAHALGLTPRQAARAWDQEVGRCRAEAEAVAAEATARREAAVRQLRQDWGAAFDERLALAKRAALAFGGDELVAALNEAGLGDDPVLLAALARIGAATAEDRGVGRGDGFQVLTPAAAQARIDQLKADPAFVQDLYDKGRPGHRAALDRWNRLVDATGPASAGPGGQGPEAF